MNLFLNSELSYNLASENNDFELLDDAYDYVTLYKNWLKILHNASKFSKVGNIFTDSNLTLPDQYLLS